MGKEKQISQILEVMDGYVVELNKFYKMSESDWVVLRLAYQCVGNMKKTDETTKSFDYLINKYGADQVCDCVIELESSFA